MYPRGTMSEVSFIRNTATNSGGAIKCYFPYSEFNESLTYPSTFTDSFDIKNQSVSSGIPSYFVFSFYDVLVEKEFNEFDDLEDWTKNASRTVYLINLL